MINSHPIRKSRFSAPQTTNEALRARTAAQAAPAYTASSSAVVFVGWDGASNPMYCYRNADGEIDRNSIVAVEDRPR
jgi:hypothetical protein